MPDFQQAEGLAHNGWMALLAAAASMLVYIAGLMCSHLAAFRVQANMRKDMMHHIMTLPLGVMERLGSGKVRKTVNECSAATETYLAHQLPDLVGACVTPAGLVFMLFAFDWRFGVFCLIPVVLGFVIMMTQMTGPVLKLGIATTVLAGVSLLIKDSLDVLTFFLFLLVASRLYDPMQAALQNFAAIISIGTNVRRMNEILDHPGQTGRESLTNAGYDVKFDHVSFSYNGEEAVLRDLSFTAKQGEVTAFVGPSGSGKTALSRLIKDKTVIVIAHRMRTIAGADKIIVLKDGEKAEEGAAEELQNVNGIYAEMVRLQTRSQGWTIG